VEREALFRIAREALFRITYEALFRITCEALSRIAGGQTTLAHIALPTSPGPGHTMVGHSPRAIGGSGQIRAIREAGTGASTRVSLAKSFMAIMEITVCVGFHVRPAKAQVRSSCDGDTMPMIPRTP
jgi:hypothetical protein